jgi:UDPglucose 6-dehydrogenase
MKVSIVGTGYVGLVSGACFADIGHDVICVDVDPRKIEMINAAKAPIHEQDLPEMLQRNVGKRLRGTTDLARAVASTDVTFIAVGTPAHAGRIDLQYVRRAAAEIGAVLRTKPGYHTVVVKSTVIPGTTDVEVREELERASGKRAGQDFGLGMNPEFLTEGRAVKDFMQPDRIVLGGVDSRTQDVLAGLYEHFTATPKIRTNTRTAEMIKYASNALLAAMISFANEFGRLCSAVGGVDVRDVMRGVHQSLYLTSREPGREPVTAGIASFLEAGCGFGGSCLPKDVTALIGKGGELGSDMTLLRSVLAINQSQPDELLRLIARRHPDQRDLNVAVLGIAFKPDTDDVRESPAFPIIRRLRAAGAQVSAYDPIARPADHPDLAGVRLTGTLADAVRAADVVVLVTRWAEFQQLPALLRELRREPLVVDGRRVLEPADFTHYEGIGR